MSGHRALRVGDSEILGGIGLAEGQAAAGCRSDALLVPWSLRWVRGLLPGAEGGTWWAGVICCLAETRDSGERRQYVRSYRRSVPRLVWTSWTPQVRFAAGAGGRRI
ncbi:MAG: hypothetical protein ACRDR6_19130 [Pseudonocardiaceae bacterium]